MVLSGACWRNPRSNLAEIPQASNASTMPASSAWSADRVLEVQRASMPARPRESSPGRIQRGFGEPPPIFAREPQHTPRAASLDNTQAVPETIPGSVPSVGSWLHLASACLGLKIQAQLIRHQRLLWWSSCTLTVQKLAQMLFLALDSFCLIYQAIWATAAFEDFAHISRTVCMALVTQFMVFAARAHVTSAMSRASSSFAAFQLVRKLLQMRQVLQEALTAVHCNHPLCPSVGAPASSPDKCSRPCNS